MLSITTLLRDGARFPGDPNQNRAHPGVADVLDPSRLCVFSDTQPIDQVDYRPRFVHLRYSAMPVGSLVHNQPTIHFVPADTVDDPDTPDPTRQSLETLLTVCIHLVSVCSLFPDPVAESKVILGLDRRSDQSPLQKNTNFDIGRSENT